MKLEYRDRLMEYAADGSRLRLKVVLGNDDGAIYPVYLPADVGNLNNQDLLEMALESVYQLNFPMRAENEKFNAIGERIAKFDNIIEDATQTIDAMRDQVELSATSRSAFLQIVMTLYGKGLLSDEDLLQTGLFDDETVE